MQQHSAKVRWFCASIFAPQSLPTRQLLTFELVTDCQELNRCSRGRGAGRGGRAQPWHAYSLMIRLDSAPTCAFTHSIVCGRSDPTQRVSERKKCRAHPSVPEQLRCGHRMQEGAPAKGGLGLQHETTPARLGLCHGICRPYAHSLWWVHRTPCVGAPASLLAPAPPPAAKPVAAYIPGYPALTEAPAPWTGASCCSWGGSP